ncbi:pyridoxal phosphate-dependent aminotransferase [Brucella anthropi]|uniref:pyridoxal phosphate-dependent aminotransferase n=1 Tax=Brucella anthropi TaxID=529 RepID=UPI00244AB24C|nr:histidinol-phosphate transaminase [Brucella anthropi]MDG9793801.1 histidinol-phosphate aminotransferase family protein [Brucella anthropi]MDH0583678.1 histidinol-phosphate aminotransferase family protein [Brucella anthropi]MDH0820196.1 histidinol-phosphate aminotransferase family protein [Brucella anthropi]MDH2087045.1 histidinol-phosphate aminotransferase family protein [Brucella anthropi]
MSINTHIRDAASVRLYEAETSVQKLALKYGLPLADMIDFSLNVNPLGAPASAVVAAARAMEHANLYPDLEFRLLRDKLAEKHGISPEQLFFGSGLDDVIKLLLHALVSDGDAVMVHLPTFPRYALEAKLRRCEVIGVRNPNGFEIDLEGMRKVLETRPVAMAFICTPNNPTGEQVDNSRIAEIASAFPQTLFIVDEALINPKKEGAVALVTQYDNTIVLRTFSKFYGLAGVRAGYAICPVPLAQMADIGRPPFNLSTSAIHAAAAALDDMEFIERCATSFAEEVNYFRSKLKTSEKVEISGHHGNMVLLSLNQMPASAAAEKLAASGIVVADATSFEGLENTATIRVSLRRRADNERLVEALLKL